MIHSDRKRVRGPDAPRARTGREFRARRLQRHPHVERLEERALLTAWVEQGPGPIINGQTQGLPSNNPVAGAVNMIAINPLDSNSVLAATVDGGIWKTTDALAANPTWTPRSDNLASLAIGAIALDPGDPSMAFAAVGLFTNGSFRNTPPGAFAGAPAFGGYYFSSDGGNTWGTSVEPQFAGLNFNSLVVTDLPTVPLPTTTVFFGTKDGNAGSTGLWKSDNNGLEHISGNGGLPAAGVTSIAVDPINGSHIYVGVPGMGVYASTDGGVNWNSVNGGGGTALGGVGASTRILVSVSAATNQPVYAAIIAGGAPTGVFRSQNGGGAWSAMGLPPAPGTNPGGTQAAINFSMVADPGAPNLVYIAGSVQANSPFVGTEFLGNSTGNTWTSIVQGGAKNTAPHADTRSMVFDRNGNLDEADDGGLYRLATPSVAATRTWTSFNGSIRPTEFYSVAYDDINQKVFGGAQDVGAPDQSASGSPNKFVWRDALQGDGLIAQVDNVSTPGHSFHYTVNQNFRSFHVDDVNNANTATGSSPVTIVTNNPLMIMAVSNPPAGMPIVVTTTAAHGLMTNDVVQITGVTRTAGGPANANGTFLVGRISATRFGIYDRTTAMPIMSNGPYDPNTGTVRKSLATFDRNFTMQAFFTTQYSTDQVAGPAGAKRLLIGSRSLYESMDGGLTVTQVANNIGKVWAIAYGSREAGTARPDVAYVGTDDANVLYTRGPAGGAFNPLPAYRAAGGGVPRSIALDPQNYKKLYVLDYNQRIWASFDAGLHWGEVTGDIAMLMVQGTPLTRNLTSIAIVSPDTNAAHTIVLVGGFGGVAVSPFPGIGGTVPHWSLLGTGLPTVLVTDVHWDQPTNRAIIGTFGRGAWTLDAPNNPPPPVRGAIFTPAGPVAAGPGSAQPVSGAPPGAIKALARPRSGGPISAPRAQGPAATLTGSQLAGAGIAFTATPNSEARLVGGSSTPLSQAAPVRPTPLAVAFTRAAPAAKKLTRLIRFHAGDLPLFDEG